VRVKSPDLSITVFGLKEANAALKLMCSGASGPQSGKAHLVLLELQLANKGNSKTMQSKKAMILLIFIIDYSFHKRASLIYDYTLFSETMQIKAVLSRG